MNQRSKPAACRAHEGATTRADCWLQQLADHTITVTEARAPQAGVAVLLFDVDDPSHFALGSTLEPDTLLALLEHQAERLRASGVGGARCGECSGSLLWSGPGSSGLARPFCPRCRG